MTSAMIIFIHLIYAYIITSSQKRIVNIRIHKKIKRRGIQVPKN